MRIPTLSAIVTLLLVAALPAVAHCEIPCGIYGDQMRVEMLREHASTIEKSMKQVVALGKASPIDHNQLVRWVDNKEVHCTEVQHIVTQYFLTQRVKAPGVDDDKGAAKYAKQLELLHGMLVSAMKAKQSTDLQHVERLRELLDAFEALYFGKKEQAHLSRDHAGHSR